LLPDGEASGARGGCRFGLAPTAALVRVNQQQQLLAIQSYLDTPSL